ncbi:MAG: hypothetical protein ACXWPS_23840, partial [Ktedonobacteraceae bacterium]
MIVFCTGMAFAAFGGKGVRDWWGHPHRRGLKHWMLCWLLVVGFSIAARHAVRSRDAPAYAGDCAHIVARRAG